MEVGPGVLSAQDWPTHDADRARQSGGKRCDEKRPPSNFLAPLLQPNEIRAKFVRNARTIGRSNRS
jgi:hypothetical protein